MSRERNPATAFSAELYKTGLYFSDFDTISVENEIYHQYIFVDGHGKPRIKCILEVKYKLSEFLKEMVLNRRQPTPQTLAFSSLVEEVNQVRLEPMKLYFIIQSEGHYPHYIFEYTDKFQFIKSIHDVDELTQFLK